MNSQRFFSGDGQTAELRVKAGPTSTARREGIGAPRGKAARGGLEPSSRDLEATPGKLGCLPAPRYRWRPLSPPRGERWTPAGTGLERSGSGIPERLQPRGTPLRQGRPSAHQRSQAGPCLDSGGLRLWGMWRADGSYPYCKAKGRTVGRRTNAVRGRRKVNP